MAKTTKKKSNTMIVSLSNGNAAINALTSKRSPSILVMVLNGLSTLKALKLDKLTLVSVAKY